MGTSTPPQEQMKDPNPMSLENLLLSQENPPPLTPDEFMKNFSGLNDPLDEAQTSHRRGYYVDSDGIGSFIQYSRQHDTDGNLIQLLTTKLNETGQIRELYLSKGIRLAGCNPDAKGIRPKIHLGMERKNNGDIELSGGLTRVRATFSPLGEENPGLFQLLKVEHPGEPYINIAQIIDDFGWSDSGVLTDVEEDVQIFNLPKFFEKVAEFADEMG